MEDNVQYESEDGDSYQWPPQHQQNTSSDDYGVGLNDNDVTASIRTPPISSCLTSPTYPPVQPKAYQHGEMFRKVHLSRILSSIPDDVANQLDEHTTARQQGDDDYIDTSGATSATSGGYVTIDIEALNETANETTNDTEVTLESQASRGADVGGRGAGRGGQGAGRGTGRGGRGTGRGGRGTGRGGRATGRGGRGTGRGAGRGGRGAGQRTDHWEGHLPQLTYLNDDLLGMQEVDDNGENGVVFEPSITSTEIPRKRGRKANEKTAFPWKDDSVFLLIDRWQEEAVLYNVNDNDYLDKHKRNIALQRITSALQETGTGPYPSQEQVLDKMNTLRSYYNTLRHKVTASAGTGSGTDSVFIPKWQFYDSLSFLADMITPRRTFSNLDEDDENSNPDDDGLPPPSSVPKNAKNKKNMPPFEQTMVAAASVLKTISERPLQQPIQPASASTPPKSADDLFGETVAKLMSTIPDSYDKGMIKLEIEKMIYQLKYSSQRSPPSTTVRGYNNNSMMMQTPPLRNSQFMNKMQSQPSSSVDVLFNR